MKESQNPFEEPQACLLIPTAHVRGVPAAYCVDAVTGSVIYTL